MTGTIKSTTTGSEYAEVLGGVVYNNGDIQNIIGDFINNGIELSLQSSNKKGNAYGLMVYTRGGAIANNGNIDLISGNFIDNSIALTASNSQSFPHAQGGAIYNAGSIDKINGNFLGNYVNGHYTKGGAIYNTGNIDSIIGDFINNYADSSIDGIGGAIYNDAKITSITGDFIGNYAEQSGGAIYNDYKTGNEINLIRSNFIANHASSGGAIDNSGDIGDIIGDFIGNYVDGYGGAIENTGMIDSLTGNFIGNYSSRNIQTWGGAIHNYYGIINNITGDFIGNYVISTSTTTSSFFDGARGGAIHNDEYGTIGNITVNFIGNYANGHYAEGGAIYNESSIGNITGDFIGNYVTGDITRGGAISSNGAGNLTSNFINNYTLGTQMAYGGAIYGSLASYDVSADKLLQLPVITINISDTGESYTFYQGIPAEVEEELNAMLEAGYKVVYVNAGEQTMTSAEWEQMKPEVDAMLESGEMATEPQITDDKYLAQLTGGLVNSSFFGNYAKSAEGEAKGGAIYTTNSLTIAADKGNSVFSGNYVEDVNGKRPEAIYVDSSAATLTLQSKNDGTILFEDQINGASGYNLKLTGDETGRVILNNDVINAKVDLSEVTLQLGREDVLNQSQSLTLNSGTLSLLNNGVGTMNLPNFSINGAVNMAVDADLANKTMDRITADNYNISEDSQLNVSHINLISDANEDKTDIQFADSAFSNNVSYTGENPIAYSKIYKYDVSYNPDDGFFTFMRGSSGNASENYNPVVLAPAVANQAGAYSTQMQVFNYAFQHSDNFMNLPYIDRLAYSRENQYALINDSTVGPYSPIFTRVNQGGYWVKPYVSFESIPLKNGPKVSNIAYGSLIGYDSKLTPIRNGFERVLTGYVGYNGANQSYSGVDTYQNGGLLGGTVTLYKGNFFNATTLSAGASVGESSNMYGHENYTMFMAGLGNKFGYNFEFQRGRYILQPSMLMSYTFVNTFDYTNAAGTRMSSDPLHAIQLSPGVKFIMNTKNGWQPYAAVNMVWNIFTDQNAKADNISLPNMSIKPYVQYGLGVQKLIKDKFLAFGQALVSNGGRNGISFSFGLRWLIGG